jgi:sigma-B regulation protein RsbU (phosphoserine phosphatase)
MKHFSILPKEFSERIEKGKQRLRFSLAIRVFFASLIFLVFPLFFHSLLNYKHRYQEEVKDILISLGFFVEGRAHFIEKTIELQKEILELVAKTLPWEEGREALSTRWKEAWPFEQTMPSDVFYLAADGRNWMCVFSSTSKMDGQYFSGSEFLQKAFAENSFAYFGKDVNDNEPHLYVTKTIFLDGQPKGLLISASPASFVLESVQISIPLFYRLDLSFVDPQDKIVVSSSPSLEGKTLKKDLSLQPVKDVEDGYVLKMGKANDLLVSVEPLYIPKGSLMVSIEEDSFSDLVTSRYWTEIFLLLASFIIVGGGLTLLIVWRVSRPLRSLYSTMEKVSQGDISARFVPDSLGFEINVLGNSFNHMIDSVIEHQSKAEAEKLQKEIYQNQLKIGREIQESLIGSNLPVFKEFDVAASYLPAQEVGGDFYDLFSQKDSIAIVMADTSGKGISACLYSLSIRSMIRAFAEDSSNISEIFSKTNRLFFHDSQDTGMFVTLWMGLYDPEKKMLHYSSAGHYPAFLKKKNHTLIELQTSSMALGVELENSFPFQSVALEKGDLLFLYTDGVFDAINRENEAFGRNRLKNFLLYNDKKTSEEWTSSLIEEITEFTEGVPQYDDITLMVIRIT